MVLPVGRSRRLAGGHCSDMDREGATVRGPGPTFWAPTSPLNASSARVPGRRSSGQVGNGWQRPMAGPSRTSVSVSPATHVMTGCISKLLVDPADGVLLPSGPVAPGSGLEPVCPVSCAGGLCGSSADGGSHDFIVSAARMITTRTNLLTADSVKLSVTILRGPVHPGRPGRRGSRIRPGADAGRPDSIGNHRNAPAPPLADDVPRRAIRVHEDGSRCEPSSTG